MPRDTSGLRPWKPGQSGNPQGRRKTVALLDALRRELAGKPFAQSSDTRLDQMVHKLVQLAIAGDMQAQRLIWEYLVGKPVQPVDVEVRERIRVVAEERNLDPKRLTALAESIANGRAG